MLGRPVCQVALKSDLKDEKEQNLPAVGPPFPLPGKLHWVPHADMLALL